MNKRGLLVIVSGPSGAGKGTVVSELIKDSSYALSISMTTRTPRETEQDGIHYFFKTVEEFEKMIEENGFLEYAKFCDNYYGTPLSYVEQKLDEGKNVILEIEVQGALQVKERYKDAILIFLTPPNITQLRERLEKRATETPEKIAMRMKRAKEEIKLIDKYDYIVINDIVEKATKSINNIVRIEKMAAKRHISLINTFLEGDN